MSFGVLKGMSSTSSAIAPFFKADSIYLCPSVFSPLIAAKRNPSRILFESYEIPRISTLFLIRAFLISSPLVRS